MGKKVKSTELDNQIKLGGETVKGVNSLYEALQKKFSIDKKQAVALEPYVGRATGYMPSEGVSYSFNPPISNPDSFVLPSYEPVNEGKYAIVDAVQRANNTYAPAGGFKTVMDAKRANASWRDNEVYAKQIYDTLGKESKGIGKAYENMVQPYNKFMSNSQNKLNIPVVTVKRNDDFGGAYSPTDRTIELITPIPYEKTSTIPDYVKMNTETLTHELTHGVQDKINNKYLRVKEKEGMYYSLPEEVHARAATLNQEYMKRTGKPLSDEKDIDEYIDKFLKYRDENRSGMLSYGQQMQAVGEPVGNWRMDESFGKGDSYNPDKGGLTFRDNFNMMDLWDSAEPLIGKQIKSDKYGKPNIEDMKKYLKALLMTTAKNEQQVPNQPNSPFTHGMDIS